jgi:hypothetical protein
MDHPSVVPVAIGVFQDLSTECGVVSISNDQTDSRTSPALKYSTHMEMINWFVCDVP